MGLLTYILELTVFLSTHRDIDRLLEDARTGKPIPQSKPAPESGVISLKDSTLSYASPVYGDWQVLLSEMIAFGEYTTDNGPHLDDWFMVFVTKDFNWVEASNYCDGRDAVREALAQHWNMESLHVDLTFSAEFNSRCIWQVGIAGKPLFDFVERPESIWQKIRSFGIDLIDKDITEEIRTHLQAASSP